jgi:L-iditol 2-dehydrogenase
VKVGIYYNNRDVRIEEQETPILGSGDVLIQVKASGICGSDLMEWYRAPRAPLVLGHEVAGEIVQVGGDVAAHLRAGDRVFATHHVPCGQCIYCLSGHETACRAFQDENNFAPGGFAELLRVTGRSVNTGILQLPEELSYEEGTFIEPLGTVVRGMRALQLARGDTVMIYGAGMAGLLFIKLARHLGAGPVIVSDTDSYRLESAKRVGASFTIAAGPDVPSLITEKSGRPADKVVVCTGAISAAEAALKSVDRGGTLLMFAVGKPGETIPVDFNSLWRRDISIKTSYGAAPVDNRESLELLRRRSVRVDDLITHRYPLEDIGEAFLMAAQPSKALKVIVEPNR